MAHFTRRAALGASALLAMPALAQPRFPDRPIKLIIPWAAGGPADIGFRIMADHASRSLGQPVVVENRGGASGILGAMAVAAVLMRLRSGSGPTPLMMELPSYRWPSPRNLALGLYERSVIFLKRVGGIILALMVLLWFLSSFPGPPEGATGPAIQYSLAGQMGRGMEVVLAPIGFNWQIAIALVPGMAAREVAVGALGTVYALSASGSDVATQLGALIGQSWSFATALSLLVWYVFAPQCISTLVAVRRETSSWKYPMIMAGYLFALAYGASFITYRLALMWGGG